ncbi:MAG: helix-turn-helix domain-containing protein [Parvibaculum sp.]|uniref:helix-turn-helix domain-containing protein n=1 Tax=Parvibaculum sp. TaxID=2024848 RepID=UPI00391948C3
MADYKTKDFHDIRRQIVGGWLKERREAVRLTQKQIADALGIGYYTFVSAMEAGRSRVPQEKYEQYARLLKVPAADLAKRVLRAEDPNAFRIIFGRG